MQGNHVQNHPQRYALSNELHARPFSKIDAPSRAACIALLSNGDAEEDRAFLRELLDRYGASYPADAADHHFVDLGKVQLKWERHTEFVTYNLFGKGVSSHPFGGDLATNFPKDWLARTPGPLITSLLLRIEGTMTIKKAESMANVEFQDWFVGESLAQSYVLDRDAVIASDFRIDAGGHTRFVLLAIGQIGQRRLGRIVQRLIEIETYKSMAMLTLPIAKDVFAKLGPLNNEISDVVRSLSQGEGTSKEGLENLLSIAAEIESLNTDHAFRFSAAEAYSAIVSQRIGILREERLLGGQTFGEFMMRRFDPAMRTCYSARARLEETSSRAARASDLLSTRVNVRTNEQNRALLEQMDNRAALQLRLQETVEGLSVVAISYYGTNLLTYLLYPLASHYDLDKTYLTAILVIPVVLLVWAMTRRVRRRLHPGKRRSGRVKS